MYCRGLKVRIVSLIIYLIMVIGLVLSVPVTGVNAEPVKEVDITEFNGFTGKITGTAGAAGSESWAVGAYEIKVQLPEDYN